MMAHHPKLTPLGELFEQATQNGMDEWGLANRLLLELQAGLIAYGYRRQFIFPNGVDRKERLPRDTHRQPIPNWFWINFDEVLGSLDSKWIDDPEDPEDSVIMDWVAGQLEAFEFDSESKEAVLFQYRMIAIPKARADALMAELAGQPKRPRGRPSGASDAWERQQSEKGFRLKQGGDTRSVPAIATSLANPKLPPDKFEKQARRIAEAIKGLLKATENSERK